MTSGGLDRRCHWLSKNKLSKRPEAILFLDAEAAIEQRSEKLQEHTFGLAAATFCTYSAENGLESVESRDFLDEIEIWNWTEELSREHEQLLIVAHNMDYDARVCRAFFYLPRLGWSPSYCVMCSSCTLFVFERGERKITLLDNMNLWNSSLAQLGESVGLPKLHEIGRAHV